MKIYSDTLTPQDLYVATPEGVDVTYGYPVSARLRSRRFDHVRLSTEHGNRWPNGGNQGGGRAAYNSGQVASPRAATYDEHGEWMAALYERDPYMILIGIERYESASDFHAKTHGRYEGRALELTRAANREHLA